MADFPKLKTGAVAQYPAARNFEYRHQMLRFVDGNEQRYRDSAGPLRRWTIRLDYLDATEASAIEDFFITNQGRFAKFTFVDPWDGASYANCSIAADDYSAVTQDDFRSLTSIVIEENRG